MRKKPAGGRGKIAEFLQFFINGIISGAVYALVAIGFNIIYSTTKIVNFAQGEFLMLGGVLEFVLLKGGLPVGVSLLISVVAVGVIGALIHRVFVAHARNASELSLIIMTIGISIMLRGMVGVLLDRNAHPVKSFLPFQSVSVLGLTFSSQYLIVMAAVVVLAVFLYFYLKRTMSGKIMRGVSMNPLAARLFGIDVEMVQMGSFAISGFIGALAGAVIAPISFVQYDIGVMFGLKGFAACVVGGFGNNYGAVVGGLIIGVAESLAAGYISSSYKDLVAFVIMILVLFIKPSGIFSSKDVERV